MVRRLGVLTQVRVISVLLLVGCAVVATAAAAGAVTLSGTITYSGNMGTVSAAHPILMELHNDPNFDHQNSKVSATTVTSSPGTFTLNAPSSGNYYLAFVLDVNGDGQPSVGEPYQIYKNQSTFPAAPISVPQTGVMLSFNDSFLLSGIAGTVRYDGTLGQVSAAQPLVVAMFSDANLTQLEGARTVTVNGGGYTFINVNGGTFYLLAFLDRHDDMQLDPDDPFEIFDGKAAAPGTAVPAAPNQTAINFEFGDENVGGEATPTPMPAVTPTPTAALCTGDCNGDQQVTVNELLILVNIVLGNAPASACPLGVPDGRGVNVSFIIETVNNILNGCPAM